MRRILLVVVLTAAALLPLPAPAIAAAPAVSGSVLVLVGDLVPQPGTGTTDHIATANLTRSIDPDAALVVGDIQYEVGRLAHYQHPDGYAGSWGRADLYDRTYPVPGNHEYGDLGQGATNDGWAATGGGYFDYWGAKARPSGASYYSFEVNLPGGGSWHVVVLNSYCTYPPAPRCDSTSAQAEWLRSDLAAHPARCTLAAFHEPLFATRAPHAGATKMRALWDIMVSRGVDLVVSGHNHVYERFKPMLSNGTVDYASGIRSTIVGTGGKSLIGFSGPVAPNSAYRDDDHFGVLKLVLRPDGWTQAFKTTTGLSEDAVSAGCH